MTIGIQLGGLASGLDTGAIIDAILAVEGRPIRVLEGRKSDERQRLTLLGTFEGLVKKLRDKAHDLQQANNFFAHKLTVGEEGVASFTLSGNARAGAHTLIVNSLAAADRYAFTGVSDPTADLSPGTLGFSVGGTAYSVTVAAGSDLNDLAAAINTAAGDDVTATIVNAGTSAAPSHQLVIAANETGADFTITGLTSTITEIGASTRVSIASNAEVVIDGLVVQRSTNLFSDVLPGVSFSVARLTPPTTPVTFTVDLDPEGIETNIKSFVEAYNEVAKFIHDQNTFSTEGGPGGPLFGDQALAAIRTNLRRALFQPDPTVLAANPDYGSMNALGIEIQADGTLELDESRLEERLSGDLDAFEDFFNRADDATTLTVDERGAFVRLEQMLDALTEDGTAVDGETRIEGLFRARRTAIDRQIRGFDDDIERLEFRLEKLEETLVAKFSALEQLLSGLQSQQAFLTANLAATQR